MRVLNATQSYVVTGANGLFIEFDNISLIKVFIK